MKTNRRDFFRLAGQLAMLSGLAGGSAYLLSRGQVVASCEAGSMCRDCKKLSKCNLDQATKYRNNER